MPKSKGRGKARRARHQHSWAVAILGRQRCLSCPEVRDVGARVSREHRTYAEDHSRGSAVDTAPGLEAFRNSGPILTERPS